ncbi:PrsW family intramembrane metalloprotease [bacterium]|nr:PrsW family intramembrane metalloprotease [bacterium]
MTVLFTITLFIALGFLPGIFWLYYFYRKDVIEPEPKSLIAKTYLVGILVAVPVVIAEIRLSPGSNSLASAVIVAPVVEEFFKMLATYWFVFNNKEFDEPMDGIVYGASIALGFASIENAGYLYSAYQMGQLQEVFIMRALLSVPGHALFSTIWGFGLGMIKFKKISIPVFCIMLLLAMAGHGIFNFVAGTGDGYLVLLMVVIGLLWGVFHRNARRAISVSPHRKFSKYVKSSQFEGESIL